MWVQFAANFLPSPHRLRSDGRWTIAVRSDYSKLCESLVVGDSHSSKKQKQKSIVHLGDRRVPKEHEAMKELREITAKHSWNIMTTSADEGQFLGMLLKLINAKKTMEIGVYAGYSPFSQPHSLSQMTILAMDINRENYELGLPVIQKAGVAHKIDFRDALRCRI